VQSTTGSAGDTQSVAADGADDQPSVPPVRDVVQVQLAAGNPSPTGSGPGPDLSQQQVVLVADLGIGYMGLGHAGMDQAPPSIPVFQSGLGHGAGGFSSTPRAQHAGRFSSIPTPAGPPAGQEDTIGPLAHGGGGFVLAASAPWDVSSPSETTGTQQTTADSTIGSTIEIEDTPKGRGLEDKQPAARTAGGNDSQLQPLVNEYSSNSKRDGTVRDDCGWVAARSQLGTLTSKSERQVPLSMLPDQGEN
jgi:hypothetical protein